MTDIEADTLADYELDKLYADQLEDELYRGWQNEVNN